VCKTILFENKYLEIDGGKVANIRKSGSKQTLFYSEKKNNIKSVGDNLENPEIIWFVD